MTFAILLAIWNDMVNGFMINPIDSPLHDSSSVLCLDLKSGVETGINICEYFSSWTCSCCTHKLFLLLDDMQELQSCLCFFRFNMIHHLLWLLKNSYVCVCSHHNVCFRGNLIALSLKKRLIYLTYRIQHGGTEVLEVHISPSLIFLRYYLWIDCF